MNGHVSLRRGLAGTMLTCAALLIVAGCDSNDDEIEFELISLTRLNENVQDRDVGGGGSFELEDDDDFNVEMEIDGVFPGIRHVQYVHELSECPDPATADLNGDGFIDFQEGVQAYGDILFPLDDNLADQNENVFPAADNDGEYEYEEEVFLFDLLDAIGIDEEDFDLEDRTVVIYGVNPATTFPATVATFGGKAVSEALPIACFEISKN